MGRDSASRSGRGGGLVGARVTIIAVTVLALGVVGKVEARAVDLAAAQRQFVTSCGTCHTSGRGEPHRQGPNLYGVYGRAAGALADFAYSDALKDGGWIWDEATLDPWIANAPDAHPGTSMIYRQNDPEKRSLLIGFLKLRSAGGPEP